MDNEQIIYEKVFASLRPPPKISMIGRKNWVQKLLDNQKAPNQPNQTLIQFIERGDLWQNKRPVRVLRKSIHVSLLTARILQFVCRTFWERQRHRQRRRCRSRWNGATRWWTLVPPARWGGHRLWGVWIATCSCETSRKFPCSWTREGDRESPSSTRSSSRSTTK